MQVRYRVSVLPGVAAGLLLGLLFVRSVTPEPGGEWTQQQPAINLALRRTAHRLLRAAGDSISRIPAVEQANAYTFRLRFNHAFDYDELPPLLSESLHRHQITTPYDVAVLDCHNQTLQVGYSVRDLTDPTGVPCAGRSLPAGCYVVQVTFTARETAAASNWPILAAVGLVVGLLVVNWRKVPIEQINTGTPAAHRLQFGQSWLDVPGQLLMAGSVQHKLTYRETKLLRLLASHPNEVMERNRILDLVWKDEGIVVSRSIDVFISRLRKLLSDDPTLRIAAVHGVGYRLEVTTPNV